MLCGVGVRLSPNSSTQSDNTKRPPPTPTHTLYLSPYFNWVFSPQIPNLFSGFSLQFSAFNWLSVRGLKQSPDVSGIVFFFSFSCQITHSVVLGSGFQFLHEVFECISCMFYPFFFPLIFHIRLVFIVNLIPEWVSNRQRICMYGYRGIASSIHKLLL